MGIHVFRKFLNWILDRVLFLWYVFVLRESRLTVEDFLKRRRWIESAGSIPRTEEIQLMPCEKINGEWCFGKPEVNAYLRREARQIAWSDLEGNRHLTQWWEDCVAYKSKSKEIATGDYLVMVPSPYSIAQIDIAPFKRSSKKLSRMKFELKERVFPSENAVFEWIEGLKNNIWITGETKIATVARPAMRQDGSGHRYSVRWNSRTVTCFGLLKASPLKVADEVILSPCAQKILLDARADVLKFWFLPASDKMSNLPRLSDEVKDRAFLLLHLSIRQALGGPEEKSEDWFERPVIELAKRIFLQHCNNHNRRHRKTLKETNEVDWDSIDSEIDRF